MLWDHVADLGVYIRLRHRDNFKIKKLKSFFILKFYHSYNRRTSHLRKQLLP